MWMWMWISTLTKRWSPSISACTMRVWGADRPAGRRDKHCGCASAFCLAAWLFLLSLTVPFVYIYIYLYMYVSLFPDHAKDHIHYTVSLSSTVVYAAYDLYQVLQAVRKMTGSPALAPMTTHRDQHFKPYH